MFTSFQSVYSKLGLIVGNYMVQSANSLVAANVSVKRIEVNLVHGFFGKINEKTLNGTSF